MKKLLVTLVAVGLLAGTANAATLWMQFEGGVNEVTLAPSDTINVEIWVDSLPGDTYGGLGQNFWPYGTPDEATYPGGVEGLVATSIAAGPGAWDQNSALDVIGLVSTYVNVFAPDIPSALSGPGSFLLGVVTIHQNDITNEGSVAFPDFYPVMFGGNPMAQSALSNANGLDITWSPAYAGYSGYYTWGQGASAISGKAPGGAFNIAADPLIIHCIPEPASLALLALGGLAIIRRR